MPGAPDPSAERRQQPLGVVAAGKRLDHGRGPSIGVEAGEEDGGLHLRARDRELVPDPVELRAVDAEGCVAVRRLDVPAHPAQRIGDAFLRTGGERLVADELEGAFLPGEQARQQAHHRAGVAAIDGLFG